MNKGKFIVFEGIDGSGKTSVARKIESELFRNMHEAVVYTKEPTEGSVGKLIRRCLNGEEKVYDNDYLQTLMMADRLEHLSEPGTGIKSLLDSGVTVLCDRFFVSTIAYGISTYSDVNAEINRHLYALRNYEDILHNMEIIYLKVDPEIALKRVKLRSNETAENISIYEEHQKLYDIKLRYEQALDTLSRKHFNVIWVNADKEADEVFKDTLSHVKNIISL